MSAADLREADTGLRQPVEDAFDHVVCCDDASVTLCGQDARVLPWVDAPTSCVVCADLEWPSSFCPRYGVCPDAGDDR